MASRASPHHETRSAEQQPAQQLGLAMQQQHGVCVWGLPRQKASGIWRGQITSHRHLDLKAASGFAPRSAFPHSLVTVLSLAVSDLRSAARPRKLPWKFHAIASQIMPSIRHAPSVGTPIRSGSLRLSCTRNHLISQHWHATEGRP